MPEVVTRQTAVEWFHNAGESTKISGWDAWGAEASINATVPNPRFRTLHAHILTIQDGLVFADAVPSRGHWSAALLAEMETADV
jgi:hypothetical protein